MLQIVEVDRVTQDGVGQSGSTQGLLRKDVGLGDAHLIDAEVLVALDRRVDHVLNTGLLRGRDGVVVLGVSIGEGHRRDEQELVHAVEGPYERGMVEVVALADVHTTLSQIGCPVGVAGKPGQLLGGQAFKEELQGQAAQVSRGSSDEQLFHVSIPFL